MATLTVQRSTRAGVVANPQAASASDEFANDGTVEARVDNGSLASVNVTFVTTKTVDGLALTDLVVAVGAGVTKRIGPFPTDVYGTTTTITFSEFADVTVELNKIV